MNQEIDEKQKVQQQVQALEAFAKQWMAAEAVARFGALKAAHPQKALQVAALVVQLAQQGQLRGKIGDAELKALLARMEPQRKETRIVRR